MAWKKYSSVLSQSSCGQWKNFTLLPLAMPVEERSAGSVESALCFVNLPHLSKAAKTEPRSTAFLEFSKKKGRSDLLFCSKNEKE